MVTTFAVTAGSCRQAVTGLFAILAAWGAPAYAMDSGMPMHAGHDMHGHAMSHDMAAPASMASGAGHDHAAHQRMMQQSGYERTVHDYRVPEQRLLDQSGTMTSLKEQLDTTKPVMLNFIFTTCTTICPVLSATFSQVQDELGSEADAVRMISVTIDPEQDTPERLSAYAERYGAGHQWRFLTGTIDDIIAVQKAFDIYRGSKLNHEPVTLLRGPGDSQWLRIQGIASAGDILGEYRTLLTEKQ